jgi:transmembrane sensor
VAEQAARWRLKLEAGVADRRALALWLRRHPSHLRSFQDVDGLWSFIDAARDDPRLVRIAREARTRAKARQRRRTAAGWGAAACLVAGVLIAALPQTDVYQNASHQRSAVRLPDGSTVTLDAMSAVVTHFSPLSRAVTLREGEARFEVAHNAWRPFVVTAGSRNVTATGTCFDVDLAGGALTVRLIRGGVRVASVRLTEGAPEVRLHPGQQLLVLHDAQTVSSFDPTAATAWEGGRLVFEDTPLSVAVARQNRYAVKPLVFEDRTLEDLRISGVFDAGDTAAFADAAARVLPLEARVGRDGTIMLSRKN